MWYILSVKGLPKPAGRIFLMKLKNTAAQSTLEYIILIAAAVATIFAFTNSSAFHNRFNAAIGDAVDQIAATSDGIAYQLPNHSVDFDIPGGDRPNTSPPAGWDNSIEFPCASGQSWNITLLYTDENGIPVFNDPDDYVGNQCADDNGWDPDSDTRINGELQIINGVLMIGNESNTGWEVFNWNNPRDIWRAFMFQRYGRYWSAGCGYGGHSSDYASWYLELFGSGASPDACSIIYDSYYGNDPLDGLEGEMAIYNGLTLYEAFVLHNMLENLFNPNSPQYVGTPSVPGSISTGWGFAQWMSLYQQAVQFGLEPDQIPFTLQDICNAFPDEACP